MTAPQEYIVQNENESIGNQKEEQGQEKTLYQQLERVVGDLQCDLIVFDFIGEMLAESFPNDESLQCVSTLIEDNVAKIRLRVNNAEELVYGLWEENR